MESLKKPAKALDATYLVTFHRMIIVVCCVTRSTMLLALIVIWALNMTVWTPDKEIDGRKGTKLHPLNRRGERIIIDNQTMNHKTISYDAFGRILSETDDSFGKNINFYSYDDQNND